MTIFGVTIDWNALVTAFGNNAVTNAIGLVGGILGAIAFFSQLPKKLKPILLSTDFVKIQLGTDLSSIESIQANFTMFNKSNQNLLITDLFVKIYENNSYTPDEDIYHATRASDGEIERDFSALMVEPSSSRAFTVYLGENLSGRSKKRINKNGLYSIEIYAVLNGTKIEKFPRIDSFNVKEQKDAPILLTSLTKAVERNRIEDRIKRFPMHSSNYKGLRERFGADLWHFVKYKLILRPFWLMRDIVGWMMLHARFLCKWLINWLVFQIIFKRYGTKTYRSRVTIGDKNKAAATSITLKKLHKILDGLTKAINKENGGPIVLSTNDREINLEKNSYKLKIYASGDGHISVHRLEAHPEIRLSFNLQNKYFSQYWQYERRLVSLHEMAIIILDLFLERTLYKS